MRKVLHLIQGADDWKAHRNTPGLFNASELAIVMGIWPFKKRSDFLREKALGIEPEHNEFTLLKFEKGHRDEAAARPIAEEIIDDDLSAMVMEDEFDGVLLSASLDGITQNYKTTFEHKSLNPNLAASLEVGEIPDIYWPQMEAGLMVSGATSCLFMTSEDGNRETMRYAWYESKPELRPKIIAACKQFAEDLANYQHVEATPEVVAAPIEALPALLVQVEGRVVATNMDAFKEKASAFIATIKTELKTDQDFADADKMAKFLGDGEKQLDAVKAQAQAQAASIDEVFRTIDAVKEQMRTTRLKLEKLVKTEKENRKGEIVSQAQSALMEHRAKLTQRLGGDFLPPIVSGQFAEAIKGLKSLASMQDAVNTALANAKIEANEVADKIDRNLRSLNLFIGQTGYGFLFPDTNALVLKEADDLDAVMAMRVNEHKAAEETRLEAERERIRKEEAERMEREINLNNLTLSTTIDTSTLPTPAQAACKQRTPEQAVIEAEEDIRAFLEAKVPASKRNSARAVLVEWIKWNAEPVDASLEKAA